MTATGDAITVQAPDAHEESQRAPVAFAWLTLLLATWITLGLLLVATLYANRTITDTGGLAEPPPVLPWCSRPGRTVPRAHRPSATRKEQLANCVPARLSGPPLGRLVVGGLAAGRDRLAPGHRHRPQQHRAGVRAKQAACLFRHPARRQRTAVWSAEVIAHARRLAAGPIRDACSLGARFDRLSAGPEPLARARGEPRQQPFRDLGHERGRRAPDEADFEGPRGTTWATGLVARWIQIAYTLSSYAVGGHRPDKAIWIANADGGDQQQLTGGPAGRVAPLVGPRSLDRFHPRGTRRIRGWIRPLDAGFGQGPQGPGFGRPPAATPKADLWRSATDGSGTKRPGHRPPGEDRPAAGRPTAGTCSSIATRGGGTRRST